MLKKNFEDIHCNDFSELISNQVSESKSLEYKLILKIDKDADKKEFLYDISSFANAVGGDIVFGMAESAEKGIPNSLEGIDGNMDETIRKIESLIKDCISPRINNVRIKSFSLDNGRSVLLIRIPQSLDSPHQVTHQGVDKFYSRSNNGKYVLDVFELKSAFIRSAKITEQIRQFVKKRIASIVADEAPAKLENNPKIILHLIPLQSVSEKNNIVSNEMLRQYMLSPLGIGSYSYRYNLEGVLNFCKSPRSDANDGYVQLFRSGVIETVNAELLRMYTQKKLIGVEKSFSVEGKIIDFVKESLDVLRKLGFQTPIYLFICLVGVKGYGLGSSRLRQPYLSEDGIDRDFLQLDEIILNDFPITVDTVLKPWFESIWNACGFEKCLSYQNGRFCGH